MSRLFARVVFRVLPLAGLALAAGCSLPLDTLRPRDGASATEDATLTPRDSGAADASHPLDASPPDASARDSGAADGPPPFIDSGPAPTPTCGVLGTPCCDPDQHCDLGACLRGVCVAYGGAFGTSSDCSPSCRSRNVYTAGCSCPRGFAPSPASHLRASCDGLASSVSLSLCTPVNRAAPSDYAGSWVQTFGCGATCLGPNDYTGGCACPAGTRAAEMEVEVETSCGTTPATFALCVGLDSTAVTFAGAYQLGAEGAAGCTEPNPWTGDCSCPAGTTLQTMPTINDIPGGFVAAPIVICSR